jgi:PAS domain S-box-containing protein
MKSHESSPEAQRADIALDDALVLRSVVEGTASDTGESFFRSLVDHLRTALGTMGAWVAVVEPEGGELRALAMRMRDKWFDGFTYRVEGTPCERAIEERHALHVPDRLVELYRDNPAMKQFGAVSYLGVPLLDAKGVVMGQLAVLDDKPMPGEPRGLAIFQIFAHRAAAEMRRLQAERAARERELELRLVLDNALDAILDFDEDFRVGLLNPAARRAFDFRAAPDGNPDVRELLQPASRERLESCARELLLPGAAQSLWIAGGLDALKHDGRSFQVEATLSHYRRDERHQFTLILRDVEERLAAEQRILALTRETRYLSAELEALQNPDRIVGSSSALLRALHALDQVKRTDTTVLLLGETGTGKELFARALHAGSKRSERPFIKLNAAALPHHLIESELFGHEKGAFTGATQRRDGRFVLADGGTLFLDEIGELPLELQSKLLRVLQEGEFEPVGSSRTRRVDVRVVAATNRDLRAGVAQGSFREDLYYRLAVFPITIPPLRERDGDVEELARVFLATYSRELGRSFAPLSEPTLAKLRAYSWPGNVRELENVIERGVIVSKNRVFDVDLALPEASPRSQRRAASAVQHDRVLSMSELAALERDNFTRALREAGGKVSGPEGAAARLGIHPSTLSSRLRALGLKSSDLLDATPPSRRPRRGRP